MPCASSKGHCIHIIYVQCLFFSQWAKEPDNVAGIENCGALRTTGSFSDRDCNSQQNFICKKGQATGTFTCIVIVLTHLNQCCSCIKNWNNKPFRNKE